jgi:two-component system, LytTR family, sensor kinase
MQVREDVERSELAAEEREGQSVGSASDGAESYWLGRRALLLNFGIWTLYGALTASNWLLSPIGDFYPYPWVLVAKAFVNSYAWALLTPLIFWFATRFNPEHRPRAGRGALLLIVGLGIGLLAASAEAFVYLRLLLPDTGEPPRDGVWALTKRYYFNEVVTFAVVLVAVFLTDVSRRYRARQREAVELQTERAELRAKTAQLQVQSAELNAQLVEARLVMLRTQLNPHFLFNTLHAVSALVRKDPTGVQNMIALLSELLRYALKDSGEQEIPLREELRLLRLYLEILEIRYQGKLKTVVAIDAAVQDALVPNLILQPLVENAVKHGLDRAGGHGTIELRATRSGDDLVMVVQDSGPGPGTAGPANQGSGVGLRLTRARLEELYGDEHRLELEPVPSGGMIARVVLPFHTSATVGYAEEVSDA